MNQNHGVRRDGLAGALLTLVGGMSWGASGTMGQYLFHHEHMDSRWLVPIRLGCAGVILFVWCFLRERELLFRPWKNRRDRAHLLIYGILGVTFCQFTYFLTIQFSTAVIGTIMQELSPALILAVTCVIRRRRPERFELISILLALAGVLLITTHGSFGALRIPAAALTAGLISVCCVTVYNMEPIVGEYPVTVLQTWAFLLGSAVTALLFRPWRAAYTPTAAGLFGIAFVVLVGNVLAFTVYMKGVQMIGPQKGILYGFSEPVTAALIGTLFLGNPFTGWDAAGFACIFAMMAIISAKPQETIS
ncbi:DMT family transporter [Lachnoclostridium sp. Marseille-P6806]|uniref:DMT family transporter n=1 Tax=Lachnoclostridium sp. Marseille-P6806 TaxID=2364793 RepID=UPI0010310E97|nr:DMT family transporter [Lachnoclostridium sp. Marseille-P6806]